MNENPLNSCRPKCCTSLYSIYRITLTTTPILAFGFIPLVCNSAGSPVMSPIQQVRHNTPLYIQDTLCWICAFISLHLHLPPWCCGIVVSQLMRYRHKIHTRRSWKSPGLPKQNRIIYRKTLTLELCEF